MTAETLDFARGGGTVARRPSTCRCSARSSRRPRARAARLEVVRDFVVPPGTKAALDVDKLRRAVGNIAANARDAMEGHGRIHISARIGRGAMAAGPLGWCSASPTRGPGVAAEIRERLFEPFVTAGKKGNGSRARGGPPLHRGPRAARSSCCRRDPPGRGAPFRIQLPLAGPGTEAGAGRGLESLHAPRRALPSSWSLLPLAAARATTRSRSSRSAGSRPTG